MISLGTLTGFVNTEARDAYIKARAELRAAYLKTKHAVQGVETWCEQDDLTLDGMERHLIGMFRRAGALLSTTGNEAADAAKAAIADALGQSPNNDELTKSEPTA